LRVKIGVDVDSLFSGMWRHVDCSVVTGI
jgi:hypothetical protein